MATRPSLNELLKNIPKEKLNQPCRDVDLRELALFITEWQTVAAYLGVTEVEVKDIELEEPGPPKKRKLSMLRKWKENFGEKATYYEVANVLWKLGRTDLVEELCKLFVNRGDDSDDGLPGTSQTSRQDVQKQPSALKIYAEYLKCRYGKQKPTFLTNQWPPPPTLKVFNLTMIKKEELQYRAIDEERARLMLQGRVSDVLQSHRSTAVNLENILEGNTLERTVVLIEGAPGSGKSTLAWHICQSWSSGKLFQEMEVVVFIELRNPTIQSANLVEDLLPGEGRSKGELVRELQAISGRNVLWILDGWDEFPEPTLVSAVQRLIFHPEDFDLHCSSVIITSRPIATAVLQRHVSARFHILGFTQAEIQQYFVATLKNSELVKQLQEQLKERPVIEASCYLPLNAAIVTHLFLAQNHTLPNTLHGVFASLVCCCLIRHVMKGSEEESKQVQSTHISSLDNLPCNLQQPFINICKLAFYGIISNKATFSAEDLMSAGFPQELQTLSLIQGTEYFSSFEKSKTYNFLHLSIQELLAAFHISKLPPSAQVQIFKNLYGKSRFAAVFCFYAAFTKLKTEGIRDIVEEIVLRETGILISARHKPQLVYLLHILYETQDLSLYQFVLSLLNGQLGLSHTSLSPVDCISVGHFLSSISYVASGEFKIYLDDCSLDDYRISLLMKQLVKNNISVATQTGTDRNATFLVLDMNLGNNKIYGSGVGAISEVISSSFRIFRLDLQNYGKSLNQIQEGEDGFAHLSHALTRNCYSSLVELNLARCSLTITHENGPYFCHMLEVNKSLTTLNLSGNEGVADVGVHYVAEGLKCNNTLKILQLACCAITAVGAEKLSDALLVNCSLEELNVGNNCLSDTGVIGMAKILVQNHTLKELHLPQCKFTEKGSKILFSDCLRENYSLLVLDVSGNQILDTCTGAEYVAVALKQNQTLKRLNLNRCGLSDDGIPSLAAALEVNTTLEVLWLGWNHFTNAGLKDIGQSLKKNTGLKWLLLEHLQEELITKDGLQQFILCLQENYHLMTLRIYTCIPFIQDSLTTAIETVNRVRGEHRVAALNVL